MGCVVSKPASSSTHGSLPSGGWENGTGEEKGDDLTGVRLVRPRGEDEERGAANPDARAPQHLITLCSTMSLSACLGRDGSGGQGSC